MLVDNGVNRYFTQVEFMTDFTGHNPSISLDHFINGGNGIIGYHFAQPGLSRSDVACCPSWKILHHLFTAVRSKQWSP